MAASQEGSFTIIAPPPPTPGHPTVQLAFFPQNFVYFNDLGNWALHETFGEDSYFWIDDAHTFTSAKLDYKGHSRLATTDLPSGFDEGWIYEETANNFFFLFSDISFTDDSGEKRFRLYSSEDGVTFNRLLTDSGTQRTAIPPQPQPQPPGGGPGQPSAANPPAGAASTSSPAPDGQKPKTFPITASNDNVVGGSATCEVDEDGTVRGHIHGENANHSGTVKFSAAVLLIGFHGGNDPNTFLHAAEYHFLTVGSQTIGTNKKDTDFVDGVKVKQEDLNNIRRIVLLLDRDKGDGDLLDQIKQLAQDAGDIVDTADVLYKKVQGSDVGQAVETTAVAAG